MKLIMPLGLILAMHLSVQNNYAQIKNAKTETIKVKGNCGMCQKTIENAGTIKGVSAVQWDKQENVATLTYNAEKTNADDILKRIALAGYDNARFRAPDDVYAALHECCQYDREIKIEHHAPSSEMANHTLHEDHQHAAEPNSSDQANQLVPVFEEYFSLKNALVKEDLATASKTARKLVKASQSVDMKALSFSEHVAWMKVTRSIVSKSEGIASTKEIAAQRALFTTLSENMYALAQKSKLGKPIYYQHCPMANDGKGANWLSKESEIKNPYYGAKMLSCGSVVNTIK